MITGLSAEEAKDSKVCRVRTDSVSAQLRVSSGPAAQCGVVGGSSGRVGLPLLTSGLGLVYFCCYTEVFRLGETD